MASLFDSVAVVAVPVYFGLPLLLFQAQGFLWRLTHLGPVTGFGRLSHVSARRHHELTQEVPFDLTLTAYPNPMLDAVQVRSRVTGSPTF